MCQESADESILNSFAGAAGCEPELLCVLCVYACETYPILPLMNWCHRRGAGDCFFIAVYLAQTAIKVHDSHCFNVFYSWRCVLQTDRLRVSSYSSSI